MWVASRLDLARARPRKMQSALVDVMTSITRGQAHHKRIVEGIVVVASSSVAKLLSFKREISASPNCSTPLAMTTTTVTMAMRTTCISRGDTIPWGSLAHTAKTMLAMDTPKRIHLIPHKVATADKTRLHKDSSSQLVIL